jgi:hypothetical protein
MVGRWKSKDGELQVMTDRRQTEFEDYKKKPVHALNVGQAGDLLSSGKDDDF